MIDWSLLEIEPTSNTNQIKKAYAKLLSKHHPEDDPEGYQKLREVYEKAIKYAKGAEKNPQHALKEESAYPYSVPEQTNSIEQPIVEVQKEKHWDELLHEVLNCIEKRMNVNDWKSLLTNDFIWNVDILSRFNQLVKNYILERPYLPYEIWEILDELLDWKNDEKLSYEKNIEEISQFDYYQTLKVKDINHELFFATRHEARNHYIQNDIREAYKKTTEAMSIYNKDVDLLKLRATICQHLLKWEEARDIYELIETIDPANITHQPEKIKVLYRLEKWDEVIKLAKEDTSKKNVKGVRILIAKAYIKSGLKKEAKGILDQMLAEDRNDIEALLLLEQLKEKRKNPFNFKTIFVIFLRNLLSIQLIALVVAIFVLQININNQVERYTGYGFVEWIKGGFQSKEVIIAESIDELLESKDGNGLVLVPFENVEHTGLYRVETIIDGKKEIRFIKEWQKENMVSDGIDEQIYVGLIDGYYIPFSHPYEYPENLKSFELLAEWQPYPDLGLYHLQTTFGLESNPGFSGFEQIFSDSEEEQMESILQEEVESNEYDYFPEDKYLVASNSHHPELLNQSLPLVVYIFLIVNSLLIILVLKNLFQKLRILLGR
ncbi:hypothetical protein GGQ92_000693 [Gracilibacillus halotolerans]|uniref:J domain-containing protein n=1 Tax=Gracilibacillus halotolerans TaxID=74386 RepID=A0A841RKB4_9BACI|nr:J domain-containing protein [Gracilibacillus halotolerans]MBB6511926.1 hypothetical protein [Gracilibacillus halotolerans]